MQNETTVKIIVAMWKHDTWRNILNQHSIFRHNINPGLPFKDKTLTLLA